MDNLILPDLLKTAQIWQQTLNWQPSEQQQILFQQLYEQILIANQKLNLTRITNPEEFWEKHLWDSLRGIYPLRQKSDSKIQANFSSSLNIIDIGTGAGFPGIPTAIVMINSTVMLMDSTRKKIAFIDQLAAELNLNNVKTITARAEEIGQQLQHREKYDIALIRAVGEGSVCAEYTLPLLKLGGLAIIYRGNWTQEETTNLKEAVKKLGGELEFIDEFSTPISHSVRHCLHLRKISPTPSKYPRMVGVPTQKPL